MTEYDLIRIWINQFPIILQRFIGIDNLGNGFNA